MIEREPEPQKAFVIHPLSGRPHHNSELQLAEAVGLAEALDVAVIGTDIVTIRAIKVGNYLGSGKIHEIGEHLAENGGNLVIVNTSLTPIQQRNLEKLWNVKVLDRTGMILEIFALRAATKEGRLQVELARLAYERSRLVRTWTHLERQRGGQGFLAGPGETQIESDRRILAQKISKLCKDLDQVRKTRALQRIKRQRAPERVIALVGYTNAGKSTLFNLITEGGVLAKDMLFATLDTTHRILRLPAGQKCVLSDTVGFISDLPTDLIDAFRATLEEVREADLLIHVRDISDPLSEDRKQDVLDVLETLQAGPNHEQDMIEVWNKIDQLDVTERQALLDSSGSTSDVATTFPLSCKTREGLQVLLAGIEEKLADQDVLVEACISPQDGRVRSWLHEHGRVISEDLQTDGHYVLKAMLPKAEAGMFYARYPQTP
ncbi:MAG TPA: GTPase HflX [Hellea balneolensis]|uniref:GTPase HflX n=1 Tax=Hellea balneolensis TaxID=287478 RepID=A0A7C3C9E6_9PROT|nr:GTPase HflX [Hellea balneolensis]